VHHAEVIAHRVGEPFGTLILALAVTVIETALIVSVMIAAPAENAGLARDTVFAAVMIVCNGIVGACLLWGGARHHEQGFQVQGASAALAVPRRSHQPHHDSSKPRDMLYAGSLVFTPPNHPVDLKNWGEWWTFLKGADWRHPYGPKSNIKALDNHPVVHIAYSDALAYATWAGKDLPTEAEWEFAARSGFDGAEYAWGNEFAPGGKHMANSWQGDFPRQNLCTDGFERTSPVTAFPPNGYGIHDMIGNVWEWTTDWYSQKHEADAAKACCIPTNPRGGREEASYDPCQPQIKIPRKVIKGGSHLCAPNYCRRYRPAARHAEAVDTSTSHLGFRCVSRTSTPGE
jgi:formylglycine-generating enzyme